MSDVVDHGVIIQIHPCATPEITPTRTGVGGGGLLYLVDAFGKMDRDATTSNVAVFRTEISCVDRRGTALSRSGDGTRGTSDVGEQGKTKTHC